MKYDVVVAGAGPVGLLLAAELKQAGASVVVVERLTEINMSIKAGGLRGNSAKLLERRGLMPRLKAESAKHGVDFASITNRRPSTDPSLARFGPDRTAGRFAPHFSGLLLPLQAGAPTEANLPAPQQVLEQVLGDWVEELGVPVLRGHEITGFDQYAHGIEVHAKTAEGGVAIFGAFLVGCDGGRSTVRKLAGFDFPGSEPLTTGYQAIVTLADPNVLPLGWNLTDRGMYIYGSKPGWLFFLELCGPPPDRDTPLTKEELEASLRRVSGTDVTITNVEASTRFADNVRQAATYRAGRILLAGDAAHIHPPLGGHGLNLGLEDAANLGWKLAAVAKGSAPESLLDSYTKERHPVAAAVLRETRAQIAIMRADPHSRAMRALFNDLIQTVPEMTTRIDRISQDYGMGYEAVGDHPLIGKFISELPGAEDAMRLPRAVLFILTADAEFDNAVSRWSDRVDIHPLTATTDLGAVLIRPDGYVVWAVDRKPNRNDLVELQAALSHWIGPGNNTCKFEGERMSTENQTVPDTIPVLIVGGSLVGLSAAMFLAARGVACLVVERHHGSSPHPRARGFTPRTLELFDTAGLRGLPEVPGTIGGLRRVRTESMVSAEIEEIDWTPKGAVPPPEAPSVPRSPHTGAGIAQDQLEPLLRQRALELGARLCLGTELIRFEDRADGVVAWLKDSQGLIRTVHADYLIGCDGSQSMVRETLGIERQGIGVIQIMRSVLFRAELEQYRRGIGQWEIEQPGLSAFLASYGDGRWVLMFRDDVERDEAELDAAIQRAIGTAVPVEIITTGRWELTGLISDQFREGPVFLAGDAAHTLPPTRGGYGANTGIADAFNLAWKLAAVLSGQSNASLLDSYEEERRPVAWMRFQQTFARPDYARYADDALRAIPLLDPVAIELGELYRSSIIEGSSADFPLARRPEEWRGQPGTRAPHRPIARVDGTSMSTLDLYGAGWVLVSSSQTWCEAATHIRRRTGIPISPINVRLVFGQHVGALIEQDMGISDCGASLVRPDGIIAWRSAEGCASVDTLERVMKIVAQTV